MEKPIIATTLSGLFVSSQPWKEAHEVGMKELANAVGNLSIAESSHSPNYFEKVEKAIAQIYPNLSPEERIAKRRGIYFQRVIDLIKANPELKHQGIIDCFEELKENYKLALITTNKEDSLKEILQALNLENFFDIIETTKPEEKDDKIIVFNRFLEKHDKPVLYIGGNRRDSFDICKEKDIPHIFANLENPDVALENVKTAYTLDDLKKLIREELR